MWKDKINLNFFCLSKGTNQLYHPVGAFLFHFSWLIVHIICFIMYSDIQGRIYVCMFVYES
jgi:hypothetical protein